VGASVTDAEHELLLDNSEQLAEIARLRELVGRLARVAIEAQDRADGRHELWLDALVAEA